MNASRRAGFTLIELLVVMGILMFLFGLGVAILPAVYQRWETSKGAEMVQAALARARQEARRSGKPTGVRLITQGGNATNLSFVQQPLMGSNAPGNAYFIPEGAGLPTRNPPANGLTYYRLADPQPIQGERDIALPQNVGIAIARCSLNGTTPAPASNWQSGTDASGNPFYDVIFNPGGGLAASSWPSGKLILWVRDTSLQDDPTKGSPTLICIYVRTGLIAAHPVDPTGAPNVTNPYNFCNDPRTSGL